MFSSRFFDGHEEVIYFFDPVVRLKAIVAIHSTFRGPALGGCRIKPYDDDRDALEDVLKLARAMTYKSAVCGLPFGGGKSVIIADPSMDKTPQLLRSFALRLHSLKGRYQTANDMGSTVLDMEIMREVTPYARGLPMANGDACPATAYGVFQGIKACMSYRLGADYQPSKCSVAVQGVGSVGYQLCAYLAQEGFKVFASDIDQLALQRAVNDFNITPVEVDKIQLLDVDVFSPCAIGGTIDEQNIPALGAKIVAGGANDQLTSSRCADMLKQRGILYAPDYVINAGGLIDMALEGDGYNVEKVLKQTESIHDRLLLIFAKADRAGRSTHDVAEEMAMFHLRDPESAHRSPLAIAHNIELGA